MIALSKLSLSPLFLKEVYQFLRCNYVKQGILIILKIYQSYPTLEK